MGMAKLNIWVSAPNEPCQTYDGDCLIHIFDCDLQPLKWGGRIYKDLKAKYGHLEIDVPPGCYLIIAQIIIGPIKEEYYKITSHSAVIQARCDEVTCTKLYFAYLKPEINVIGHEIGRLLKHKLVKAEICNKAIEALKALSDSMPDPPKSIDFEKLGDAT